jgi:hypothetical protein
LLEPLFPPGPRLVTGDRARHYIGAIIMKLGTGMGWSAVNAECGTTSAVSSFYQSCRRSRKWPIVAATIVKTRKPKTLPTESAFARVT